MQRLADPQPCPEPAGQGKTQGKCFLVYLCHKLFRAFMSLYKYIQSGTPSHGCQALRAGTTQQHGLSPNLAPQGALGCLDKAEI